MSDVVVMMFVVVVQLERLLVALGWAVLVFPPCKLQRELILAVVVVVVVLVVIVGVVVLVVIVGMVVVNVIVGMVVVVIVEDVVWLWCGDV